MIGEDPASDAFTTKIPGYARASVGRADITASVDALAFVCEAIADRGSLYNYAASRPGAETLRGRGTLYVVPGPHERRWLVRRLTHGGLLAPISGDRFLLTGTPRPLNELRLSWELRELGVRTPRVQAAIVYRSAFFYRGEIAREHIDQAVDLAALLFADIDRPSIERQAALDAAGRLLGRLHQVGLVHPDLNLRNILIETADAGLHAHILDLEKCRRVERVTADQRRRMLGRLRRSARRFEGRGGAAISASEWEVFDAAYAEGMGGGDRPSRAGL